MGLTYTIRLLPSRQYYRIFCILGLHTSPVIKTKTLALLPSPFNPAISPFLLPASPFNLSSGCLVKTVQLIGWAVGAIWQSVQTHWGCWIFRFIRVSSYFLIGLSEHHVTAAPLSDWSGCVTWLVSRALIGWPPPRDTRIWVYPLGAGESRSKGYISGRPAWPRDPHSTSRDHHLARPLGNL